MPPRHTALAVLVAALWGVNFVIIDIALRSFPPLLLTALRFTLVALPAIAVFRRPPVALRWLVGVGLFLSAAHFGLLFVAMDRGMPAGLASLVMQLQVVFTIGLGVALLDERLRPLDLVGGAIALTGLGVIAAGRSSAVPLAAMALCVSAAASWAVGNLCTKRAQAPDPFALLVWSSLVPPVPLLCASLAVEGPTAISEALTTLDVAGIVALLYIVVVSTLVGFGLWAWLLRRHAISSVAPYTLLVPVVGIAAAWAALGERPAAGESAGAALVLAGAAVTTRAASRARPTRTSHP
jgi:O-acetylserine/cysteine efflux transporter